MTLGQRVRALREAAGISRAALATKAETSNSTLVRIELEGHYPNAALVRRLADVLGVSVGALLDDEPTRASA